MNTLHLLPNGLGTKDIRPWLAPEAVEAMGHCSRFIAESAPAALRMLSALGLAQEGVRPEIFLLNEHTDARDLVDLSRWFRTDGDIGLVSDAGCPGIADPGAHAVRMAHHAGWAVVPHVGPSSIVLALMASGLNGQSFAFKGYLPRDPGRRDKLWREMLEGLNRRRETQIFMEPPYRNAQAFGECLSRLPGDTALCVAADLTLPDAIVVTRSIEEWRELPAPPLQKRPCLFLVGH